MTSTDPTEEAPKKNLFIRIAYFAGKIVLKFFTLLNGLIYSKGIMLVFLLLFLYGPFVFIQISINNPSFDTTPITNIAFAILVGLASVSFSWARAIEQDDKRLVRSIVYAGEVSLQAAIFFLMASAFKYLSLNKFEFIVQPEPPSLKVFRLIMLIASMILFLVAVTNFLGVLSNLLFVLRKRMKLGDNLPTDFDNWKD